MRQWRQPAGLIPQQESLCLQAQARPGPTTCLLALRQKPATMGTFPGRTLQYQAKGEAWALHMQKQRQGSGGFPGHRKAGKCEPAAGAGAWFPERGLLQAVVCFVAFNRGLLRLGLKGGI